MINTIWGGSHRQGLKQKELSPMLELLLKSLVPEHEVRRYKQEELRQEAFLLGVADPSGAVPAGHVFLPGLKQGEQLKEVLVTRCPCVSASDGKRLPVVTERPPKMSSQVPYSIVNGIYLFISTNSFTFLRIHWHVMYFCIELMLLVRTGRRCKKGPSERLSSLWGRHLMERSQSRSPRETSTETCTSFVPLVFEKLLSLTSMRA